MKKRTIDQIAKTIAKVRASSIQNVARNYSNRPPAAAYEALMVNIAAAVAAGIRADRRQRGKS